MNIDNFVFLSISLVALVTLVFLCELFLRGLRELWMMIKLVCHEKGNED